MIRRPPRSTLSSSSAASDVYKRQEREGDVGHAARHLHAWQSRLDPLRGLEEIQCVGVMLLDTGRDREDVRVEDDVLGRKADLVGEDAGGPGGDRDLALGGRRL